MVLDCNQKKIQRLSKSQKFESCDLKMNLKDDKCCTCEMAVSKTVDTRG